MISIEARPMTFDAGNEWLRSRVTTPKGMTSAELAMDPEFGARVRAHSFFSAQVEQANVLEAIRQELDRYAVGEIDLATARWRCKTALTRLGYAADDVGMSDTPPAGVDADEWAALKRIMNLASTRRLDLILQQNARMGWAVGRKRVGMHPAVRKRWPNWRYIARRDKRTRSTHAALDGLVLGKDDPFWDTHTPPWEFRCRCDIENSDEAPTATADTSENADGSQTARVTDAATGEVLDVPPSESGYVFRSDEPFGTLDMSRIHNVTMREAVERRLQELKEQA